jgi:galactose mutarotase-like enzyme
MDDRIIKLEKDNVKVKIDLLGGSIISITIDDKEYMWQNETKIWPDLSRKPDASNQPAPSLFPTVSKLETIDEISKKPEYNKLIEGPIIKDGKKIYKVGDNYYDSETPGYMYEGNFYPMKHHGFLRDSMFEKIESTPSSCTVVFKSNDITKKSYPFDFEFRTTYSLTPFGVNVTYNIKNTGDRKMPFNIGDHPGFKIEGNIEDYSVRFSHDEESKVSYVNGKGENVSRKIEDRVLHLTKDMFENKDPKIILGSKSKRVVLYKKETPILKYNTKANNLLFWSADKNFLCIEPWYGWPKLFNNMEENIRNGKILTLIPGKEFELRRRMSFYDNEYFRARLKSYIEALAGTSEDKASSQEDKINSKRL